MVCAVPSLLAEESDRIERVRCVPGNGDGDGTGDIETDNTEPLLGTLGIVGMVVCVAACD